MATFAQMKTYVSARLIDPNNQAVTADQVGEALNDAVKYWKFRRFWFNEVTDSATLTQQDPSFPYPSDFLVPSLDDDGFYIQYSGVRYPLMKISEPQYDSLFLENGYGLPAWYARMGSDNYQCYPIPDQNYVVGRHYIKDYVDLSADSDTNDFSIYAARLIELWALANLSAELRQDDKMETYYRSASNDEYRNLRVMTDKSNSSGKLTIASTLYTTY